MRRPNHVLLLFRKDLLRRRRSPLGVLALIAFPIIFSAMLAVSFGGGGGPTLRARLLVEDRDGSLAGGLIKNFLQAEQVSDFLEVVAVDDEGLAMIEDDQASALLRIPDGATEKLAGGEAVTLELIRNPAQGILPEVAEQVTAILADVLSLLTRLLRQQMETLGLDSSEGLDSVSLGDLSIPDLDDLTDADFARLAVSLRHAFEEVGTFLSEPPLTLETATLGEEETEDDDDGGSAINIFLLILPGISVYALFLIGDQMMRDILTEARLGTLRRQLSAPITTAHVIAAKLLVTATVAAVVLVILSAFAAVFVSGSVHFPAFVLLSLSLVLSVTGFATAIYSVARTENQGSTFSALFYLTMGFAGGSFFPVDQMPAAVRAIAPASPFYWGTRGFQRLLDDGGLADVLGSVAVLGGSGLLLLVAGTFLLQRKVLRGDTP